MTRRTIASESKVGSGGSKFPKLEFKNKGEYHRVLLFQMDEDGKAVVWQEWVHVLRVPKFKEDNTPKMVLKDSRRGDEGDKYEDYDTDWLGTPLCLGDPEVNEKEGFDPDNCPDCAAVPEAPTEAKLHPQLAIAVNVVEYALTPGTWNVQTPLSARVVVWRMNTGTYDDIISQQEQHGELLRHQDLTLEVVSPSFRTVKMGVMAPSGWETTPSGAAYLAELLGTPGNIASDDQLRAACGRDAKRLFMQEDLGICLKKWRRAKAALEGADFAGAVVLGGGQQPTLAQAVSELNSQPDPAEVAQQVAAMREQTRAEVTAIVNPDPFAAAAMGGMSEFTKDNSQAAAEQQHAQAMSSQPLPADPFAAVGQAAAHSGSATPSPASAAPPASTPAAPPSDPFAAAGQASPSAPSQAENPAAATVPAGTPTAPPHSDPFAMAAQQSAAAVAPTTAGSPGSPDAQSGKQAVSFEDMIASLNRGQA